jgi:hypothetical protein
VPLILVHACRGRDVLHRQYPSQSRSDPDLRDGEHPA